MGIKRIARILAAVEKRWQQLIEVLDGGRKRVGIDMGSPMYRMILASEDVLENAKKLTYSFLAIGYTREQFKDIVFVYDFALDYPAKFEELVMRSAGDLDTGVRDKHVKALAHCEAMHKAGFTCVIAGGEAEAQLAALLRDGIRFNNAIPKIDVALSNDSDMLGKSSSCSLPASPVAAPRTQKAADCTRPTARFIASLCSWRSWRLAPPWRRRGRRCSVADSERSSPTLSEIKRASAIAAQDRRRQRDE